MCQREAGTGEFSYPISTLVRPSLLFFCLRAGLIHFHKLARRPGPIKRLINKAKSRQLSELSKAAIFNKSVRRMEKRHSWLCLPACLPGSSSLLTFWVGWEEFLPSHAASCIFLLSLNRSLRLHSRKHTEMRVLSCKLYMSKEKSLRVECAFYGGVRAPTPEAARSAPAREAPDLRFEKMRQQFSLTLCESHAISGWETWDEREARMGREERKRKEKERQKKRMREKRKQEREGENEG